MSLAIWMPAMFLPGNCRHGAVHPVSGSVRQNLKRQFSGSTDDLHHVDFFGFSFCLSVYGAGKTGVVLIVYPLRGSILPVTTRGAESRCDRHHGETRAVRMDQELTF